MSDPLLKHEPENARFVVYSPTRGVYMGEDSTGTPLWSKNTKPARQTIYPTYSRADGQRKISSLWNDPPNDYKLMQCYPSRGDGATTTDLNNAAIVI